MSTSPSTPVYLDHAAATPIRPAALEAMTAALGVVGNASSLHGSGRAARRSLEEARESIARSLGARPSEVIFTGGGTEADNLAVKGIFWARRDADRRRTRIVLSAVEHHAVLDPASWLADHEDAELTVLGVDECGRVDPAELRSVLAEYGDQVALVSVMWANNEVGTVQPIAQLASVAHEFDIPFHTDAIAAVGHVPVNFAVSGVDAMSVAAHKFGGPPGVGALLLGRSVAVTPLAHGGGHERDVRSGTPDVPAALGMATALDQAVEELPTSMKTVAAQRDRLVRGVVAATEMCVVNADGADRLPGIAHFRFDDCEGDSLLMLLDAKGIECSTGSACTAGVARASHVLLAMGVSARDARGSLRFSLSETTTGSDVDRVIEAIGDVVARARAAGAPRELVGER